MKSHPPSAVLDAFRAYKRQIFRHRKFAIPGLVLPGGAMVFTNYIPPLVIAAMIKHFNGQVPSSLDETIPYIALLAGAWLFGEAIWRVAFLLLNRADSRSIRDLYIEAFDQLLKKDMGFFNDNFAGSLTKKVVSYSKSFEGFMDTLAFNVFGNLLPLLFGCIILWTISPWLVLALISMITLTLLCVLPFIKRRQKLTIIREKKANEVSGHIADVFGNIAAVQAFAHDDQERKNHTMLTTSYMASALKAWDYHVTRIDMITAPLYVIANVIGLVLAIILSDNAVTMAAIFLTFSYFIQATRILFEFNRTYRNIENALSEGGQFCELLHEPPKLVDMPDASTLEVKKAEIRFDNVTFAYKDDGQESLFEQLDLRIPSGQKVAVVGHSGGGKTTITRLLLRFNDIQDGQILIDDQNIARVTTRSLRHAIAYVPQDPVMFHRSLMDNIRYGRPDATDEEVTAAARKAHATEFIDKLPEGFETLVGERGVKLSGGQRQRIAIARAILKDAPILVLDEATSALDSESEKLIQASLNELMKDRTSIVIAHRLSTIQKMDRILVLENGTIVEDGTHTELQRNKGIYATLWAHQSGGFIEE